VPGGRKAMEAMAPRGYATAGQIFKILAILDFSYRLLTVSVIEMSKMTKISFSVKMLVAQDQQNVTLIGL
jgi:hypothetical protein